MQSIDEVKLEHFSNEHMKELATFELPEEQAQFTALPSKYKVVKEGQHRIVLLCGNKPVGFFLLHSTDRIKEYSNNPNAMLLTTLSVNYAEQGKGYAKQAMLLLRDFVKSEFPSCDEIVLAVNHKNFPAQKLYSKVGFKDTGRRKIGRIGEQFIFNLDL
ncbi:GNAT family N-acetyltransferase [Ornithinibacillus sp. BX22]|uniref:GNAT family N-acetyltransferase n=2 Tax=Ornithinibacillus TaxID=484508 RepID=A0A923L9A5_9BACI|nr:MULTISPECIES: GNAT family N-acetyltransferase [Ornithinibacillus]MBC5638754.1 GNAT family N-acetyltransferase [Ornithinibacillus hominis]MBS3679875.1 GNAT family N-acetyltransferase [Ornithinibacillus massiliensis]